MIHVGNTTKHTRAKNSATQVTTVKVFEFYAFYSVCLVLLNPGPPLNIVGFTSNVSRLRELSFQGILTY